MADAGPPDSEATMQVLFCCSPDYYPHLAVTLASLVQSHRAAKLRIHLITSRRDAGAETRLRRSLLICAAGGDPPPLAIYSLAAPVGWHTSFHITADAYLRLFAAEVLPPTVAKALYLDADLLVVDDLTALWRTDVTQHAVAAAPDPFGTHRRAALGLSADAPYVNSGVLLLNLARWRAEGLTARLQAFIESQGSRLLFHDQDAINGVLHDQLLILDYRWNLQARMLRRAGRRGLPDRQRIARAARAPAVIHFTSIRKPWLFVMAVPGKSLWRRYARQTAWSARPVDQRWSALPEWAANHLLYAAGLDYTWERLLRSTTPGRAIVRLAQAAARAARAFSRLMPHARTALK